MTTNEFFGPVTDTPLVLLYDKARVNNELFENGFFFQEHEVKELYVASFYDNKQSKESGALCLNFTAILQLEPDELIINFVKPEFIPLEKLISFKCLGPDAKKEELVQPRKEEMFKTIMNVCGQVVDMTPKSEAKQ